MKYNLNNMIKGWFVGDFEPTVISSKDFEVGVKRYKKGDSEAKHVHKVATEITVIVEGKVKMNDIEYVKDDIIKIGPNEPTKFECLEDAITVVVKTPSVMDDKYIIEE